MKLYYYIKHFFKTLKATLLVNVLSFVALPLIVSLVMGFIQKSMFENPLKLTTIEARIVDNDNSDMSSNLEQFLRSKELNEIIDFDFEDKKDYDLDIIIPKGYEDSLLNKESSIVNIREVDSSEIKLNTIKSIIDSYHENIFIASSGIDPNFINNIYNVESIEETYLESEMNVQKGSYGYFANSLISYVCAILFWSICAASTIKLSKDIDKRAACTPTGKGELFIYEYIISILYFAFVIGCYVLLYRVLDITFQGDILNLLLIILFSSIFMSSLSTFISGVFGEKARLVVGFVIFALPLIGGGMFTVEKNFFSKISPTDYISDMFAMYSAGGNINEILSISLPLLGIAIILVTIAFLKTILCRRKSI